LGPLLTISVHESLLSALHTGASTAQCSLDLDRSTTTVAVDGTSWTWAEQRFPFLESCKDWTIYHWTGGSFEPVARFTNSLIKLVPTPWGPPTFEIDGIKMLPTAKVSPYSDAERKVGLIEPRGKRILDTCAGLGYFAAWCVQGHAAEVISFEKNPDVLWLRTLNPWSPQPDQTLILNQGDIAAEIATLPSESFDAALHDPPRFGIAGELYSQAFYDQLARVLKRNAKLFHYTGTPNKLTSGRNLPNEVAKRMKVAGFAVQVVGDGILATKGSGSPKWR
jgi:predicted methyltransferase